MWNLVTYPKYPFKTNKYNFNKPTQYIILNYESVGCQCTIIHNTGVTNLLIE